MVTWKNKEKYINADEVILFIEYLWVFTVLMEIYMGNLFGYIHRSRKRIKKVIDDSIWCD